MISGPVQHVLRLLGMHDLVQSKLVRAQRIRRKMLRSDKRLLNKYLQVSVEPKLQIGGGWHRLDGWLNTDLEICPEVMLMDATERFPFPDETFRFVYSEHMIEHVPYANGLRMLRECYRVMRKGGVIRVTTPDLAAITGLASQNPSDIQKEYLSWFCETFVPRELPPRAAYAINAHFRLWGHQFIYDEETLAAAFYAAGFKSVQRRRLRQSDHPALRNLENTERYPEGLLEFESMALEGFKSQT